VIKNVKSEKDNDVITTIIERSNDVETGEKTVEKHIYFVDKYGKQRSKYIKEVYDENNNLLTFAEDNSKVTTYTYNEDGKRETAITKQLIDEEFVVIDSITYTYSTDEETGEEKKTRVEERYDAKGNITHKQTHTESITDTKKEYTVENRVYEVPESDDSNTNP
jgi:YD repeat-containing protein